MPDFDPRAYEDEVLKPLRRHRTGRLPDDLLVRYAVDPAMGAPAMRDRIDMVVRLWNKQAMRAGSLGLVCKQLAREHDALTAEGHDLATPAFWVQWVTERVSRLGAQVDELVDLLTRAYGGLGVITADQLRAAAAAHVALGPAELDQACRRAGLRMVEPVELPTGPVSRGRVDILVTALATAGAPTVAHLLQPKLTSFTVLDTLTITPPPVPPMALDAAGLAARMHELEKVPDTPTLRAQKDAVGFLQSEARHGTDLRALALFHLLQEAREQRSAPPVVLHTLLRRTGLADPDAARLAASIAAEAGTPVRDPLTAVHDLLGEGRLVAAEAAAATLTGPEGDTARETVVRQRGQVEELRRLALADLRAGDDERAGARLRDALRLAVDLPGLAEELAAIPASPVLGVTAAAEGSGVRISWRPAPDHDEHTEFRVVRGTGRPPGDADDGAAVAGEPGPSGSATVDGAPPVGRLLHYAVFARSAGGRWSRSAGASVQVVPPVGDLTVEGEAGAVVGRWRCHPDVAVVEVHRHEGAPDGPAVAVPPDGHRSFRDTAARDGVRYFYSVVACYPPAGGRAAVRSAAEVRRAATRLEARPVPKLTAVPVAGPAVRLGWRQKPGTEVVVRRSDTPCRWEYGEEVALDRVSTWGSELDGTVTVKGDAVTMVAAVPAGRSYCVPFTLGPEHAVRGELAVVDLTDPVRRLRAQRFGDDVRVTWTWPDEVNAAELTWAGGQRRITLSQYRDEGGTLLRAVPGLHRVDVVAVALDGAGAESRAPAVNAEVEGRPVRLSYGVRRRGHRLVGGVKCTVTLSAAEDVSGATLVLIGAAGQVLPLDPDAGVELLRAPVVVRAGVPLDLPEVVLPSVLRRPFWLRCFLTGSASAVLVDPPLTELKVS